MDARLGPLALAVLLVLAGCVGGAPGGDETRTTPTTDAADGTATTTSTATTTDDPTTSPDPPSTRTDDAPPKGSQFVSVVAFENQSRHAQWPDNQTVAFEDLPADRQRVFEEALSGGSVEFGPDETAPFSFYDESRPRAVRYDGTWYYVRVAIV
ncbi:hypothetical protein [Halorussus sp. MSC15.2]|uniref:hypothetical protein n=1 Tax=Halorussus sp. MSC15.2 TaxID=2283638 RepID=UPI0013D62D60|nr:hypothetical protein [Halorussus sp. MSC15.2]NEU57926.1 hypothetical protein [Halorussus sp. MSC15.2]